MKSHEQNHQGDHSRIGRSCRQFPTAAAATTRDRRSLLDEEGKNRRTSSSSRDKTVSVGSSTRPSFSLTKSAPKEAIEHSSNQGTSRGYMPCTSGRPGSGGVPCGTEHGAYADIGDTRELSSRGPRDEGLHIIKEAEKRAYQEVGEALNLVLGQDEFGSRDEHDQYAEKMANQEIGEALNLALGYAEFTSGDELAQYAFAADAATIGTRAAHTTRLDQVSDERAMESAMLPMPSLRRSQLAVFDAGQASADGSELRHPAQRVVKIQPEEGHMRPGAYAHTEPPRRFSNLAREDGSRRPYGVAGTSLNSDDDSLLSLSYVPSAPTGMVLAESMETRNKPNMCRFCLVVLWLVALTALAAAVVGVIVFMSGSKFADETRACTSEGSMAAIEQQCSYTTTVIPGCIMKLRKELASRLGMDTPEDGNVCSAESLSLFSVALHASKEDTPVTLLNRLGLTLLYYATNGRDWSKGSDWASSKLYCEWEGVSCNEQGNVIALLMEAANMMGSLPSGILTLLPKLTSLSLRGNKLTGTIPPELSQLNEFSARANSLTGTLGREFFKSTSLQALDLSQNKQLTVKPIPFVGRQWKSLLLKGTTVGAGFLSNVSVLSNLETLNLYDANLTGALPTEIGKLTSLRKLWVHGNLFLGGVVPAEFQNLTKLQHLRLESCEFSGTIPSSLGKMTELRVLDISDNNLTGGLPTELGLLRKLTSLLFNNNKLDGTIPSEVCELRIDGGLVDLGNFAFGVLEDDGGMLSSPYGGLICPIEPGCCSWN